MHYRLRTLLIWIKPVLFTMMAAYCLASAALDNLDPVLRVWIVGVSVIFSLSAKQHVRRAMQSN